MTSWSALLRVFLSIALVLNGIGGAIASTRMHLDQPSTAEQAASQKVASTAMPCHEHQNVPVAQGHAGQTSDPAPSGKAPAPDCCKSGAGACAGAHAAQVAFAVLQAAVPVLNRSAAVKPMLLAHAAPELPHLIRPPIG